jgi:hypothetical protein
MTCTLQNSYCKSTESKTLKYGRPRFYESIFEDKDVHVHELLVDAVSHESDAKSAVKIVKKGALNLRRCYIGRASQNIPDLEFDPLPPLS